MNMQKETMWHAIDYNEALRALKTDPKDRKH